MAEPLEQEQEPKEETPEANAHGGRIIDDHTAQPFPTGLRLWSIVAGLVFAMLCYALDETIVATAIPKITEEFRSVGDVGWYGSAYLAACCVCQPIFGNLYQALSIKRTFLGAAMLFEIGNIISGSAQSSVAVISGRAVAGAGCAGLNAGTWLIVSKIAPLHQRPLYASGISSVYGAAAIAGPLLGGFVAQYASWRWVFFVNLPIGGATFILMLLSYCDERRPETEVRTWTQLLNRTLLASTFIFALAIISLLLALQYGGAQHPWSDRKPVAFLTVFSVALVAFVALQVAKKDQGLIPWRMVSRRSIAAGLWYLFCSGSSSTILIYFLPLWFQAVQGFTASKSGILTIPFLLGFVVFGVLAGAIVSRIGYYVPCMLAGTLLLSVGCGMLSTLTVASTMSAYIGYQVLYAAGAGLGNNQPMIAVQATLDPQDVAVGTATVALWQTLGAAVFLIVAQSIFSRRLVDRLRRAGANVDAAQVLQSGATSLLTNPALRSIPHETLLHSYSQAIVSTFALAAGLSAATAIGSLAMEWRSVKKSTTQTSSST